MSAGTETKLVAYEPSAYNTVPGTPAGAYIYCRSHDLSGNQPRVDDDTLVPGTVVKTRPDLGLMDARGTIRTYLAAEDHGILLKHLIGDVNTTGSGPHTHEISPGNYTAGGLLLEKDNGASISGTGRFEQFGGIRVASGRFRFAPGGYCEADYTVIGASHTLAAAALDASPTDPGHTSFFGTSGSVLEGGGAGSGIESVEFTINRNPDENQYEFGGGGSRFAMDGGFFACSGTVTAFFKNADLINKAVNDQDSSIKITLTRGTGTGSAGNEKISFDISKLVYGRASAPVEGPQGLKITLPFQSFRSGADLGFKSTVFNALSAI